MIGTLLLYEISVDRNGRNNGGMLLTPIDLVNRRMKGGGGKQRIS